MMHGHTYIKFVSERWAVPCGQMNRRTDMTKLRVAFRNFAKTPENPKILVFSTSSKHRIW